MRKLIVSLCLIACSIGIQAQTWQITANEADEVALDLKILPCEEQIDIK